MTDPLSPSSARARLEEWLQALDLFLGAIIEWRGANSHAWLVQSASDLRERGKQASLAGGKSKEIEIAALSAERDTLARLADTWEGYGLSVDAFHATMGAGWKACAKELRAVLASGAVPSSGDQTQELER